MEVRGTNLVVLAGCLMFAVPNEAARILCTVDAAKKGPIRREKASVGKC